MINISHDRNFIIGLDDTAQRSLYFVPSNFGVISPTMRSKVTLIIVERKDQDSPSVLTMSSVNTFESKRFTVLLPSKSGIM